MSRSSPRKHNVGHDDGPGRRQQHGGQHRPPAHAYPVHGPLPAVDEGAGGEDHGADVQDESPYDDDENVTEGVARAQDHLGGVGDKGRREIIAHGCFLGSRAQFLGTTERRNWALGRVGGD
ncbi:hypothetical protein VCV18_001219 [Metarhizium anisopliae]